MLKSFKKIATYAVSTLLALGTAMPAMAADGWNLLYDA